MKSIFEFGKWQNETSDEKKTEVENRQSKTLLQRIGKDRLIICILGGLLLAVIAIPVEKKENTAVSSKEQVMEREQTEEKKQSGQTALSGQKETVSGEEYSKALAEEVEEILKYMDGVGKVKVLVTMETKGEVVVEKDSPFTRSNTLETDSEGGNRNISNMENQEETVYITDAEGNKTPYVIKEIAPLVKGIVVVAEGGEKSQVKENITEALVALFDIEPHKVKVIKMRSDVE